jgi:hypothetical protein
MDEAPKNTDITQFGSSDDMAVEGSLFLANEMKKARKFTNVGKFELICGECNTGLTGAVDAMAHS